jgi:GT2 family glycosyltransferase
MPLDQFEVIIVDNAASTGDQDRLTSEFRLDITYIQQADLGATRSRNMGANRSRGEVLVFQDDDIVLQPQSLELLTDTIAEHETTIVLGNLVLPEQIRNNSVFSQINAKNTNKTQPHEIAAVHYTKCMTGLLAIKRKLFYEIGMFQDPTGGWPNWDDVDFGYRAHLAGYSILKHQGAVSEHWDHTASDLSCACNRWFRASKSAVLMFHKYPDLQSQIPMFFDKTPIDWGQAGCCVCFTGG